MALAPLRTASLGRFLSQEALIRDAMESGIDRGIDIPDDNDPDWLAIVRFQIETACIRMVDNFLSYLSEILQLAIAKKPEILKSNKTITFNEVMKFSRHADLVSFLIDRTINELSYQSFVEIGKYIKEKTNISVTSSKNEERLLMVAIELRNIYTHNRGEASDATINRLEKFENPLEMVHGELVETSIELLEELMTNISKIAKRSAVVTDIIQAFAARQSAPTHVPMR